MFSVVNQLNCDSSQKNSAVVIFKEIAAVFLFPAVIKAEVKHAGIKHIKTEFQMKGLNQIEIKKNFKLVTVAYDAYRYSADNDKCRDRT